MPRRLAGMLAALLTLGVQAPRTADAMVRPAVLAGTAAAAEPETAAGTEATTMKSDDASRDFDFWMGAWKIHNRRLRVRLRGGTTWDEFEATAVARPLLGGVGNEDVFRMDGDSGYTGMSFRFFDKATRRWSIYWADSRKGTLEPPVVGSFSGDTGVFEGTDTFEGRTIRVRYTWSRVTTPTPRWEQAFSDDGGETWETNWVMDMTRDVDIGARDFPVVELRRYVIKPGERERFARCFDGYFPEAFQQTGAIAFGQFLERKNDTWFAWLRGFPNLDARAEMNAAFYDSAVWKEHAAEMNDRMVDSDNVLLLRPLAPGRGLPVLPTADLATEAEGPAGVAVLHVFAVKPGAVEAAARRAEDAFAAYRSAGAREAGVLVTLDVPNNFPRLPIRTDGPYLVWVGIVKDDPGLARLAHLAERAARSLEAEGLLRGTPELVVLDPTRRSRLRWRPEWN